MARLVPVTQRYPDLVVPKSPPVEVTAPAEVPEEEQPDRQISDQSSEESIPVERSQPSDKPSRMAEIPDPASPSQQAPVGFTPRRISPQRRSLLTRQRRQPQRYGDVRRISGYEDFE